LVFDCCGVVVFWGHREDAVEIWRGTRREYFLSTNKIFEDWLDRLIVMGVIKEEDWHRENGKYSGFPECCINWFLHVSCHMGIKFPLLYTDAICGRDESDYEYVLCPNCRKKLNGRGD